MPANPSSATLNGFTLNSHAQKLTPPPAIVNGNGAIPPPPPPSSDLTTPTEEATPTQHKEDIAENEESLQSQP